MNTLRCCMAWFSGDALSPTPSSCEVCMAVVSLRFIVLDWRASTEGRIMLYCAADGLFELGEATCEPSPRGDSVPAPGAYLFSIKLLLLALLIR